MADQYIIVSVTHNNRHDKYILLWRPDDKGYTFLVHNAGRYDKERVMSHLDYYNSGSSNLAVPASLIELMAVRVRKGYFDDEGEAVSNTVATWNCD